MYLLKNFIVFASYSCEMRFADIEMSVKYEFMERDSLSIEFRHEEKYY